MSEESEFQKQLLNQLSSIIGGMKMLNDRISSNVETVGRFDAEFTKLSRQNNQLRSDILEMKGVQEQTNLRLQSLLHRIDEIENVIDGNSNQIRDLRSEVRGHYNDILTAIQDGIKNSISFRELEERVEELERRSGM